MSEWFLISNIYCVVWFFILTFLLWFFMVRLQRTFHKWIFAGNWSIVQQNKDLVVFSISISLSAKREYIKKNVLSYSIVNLFGILGYSKKKLYRGNWWTIYTNPTGNFEYKLSPGNLGVDTPGKWNFVKKGLENNYMLAIVYEERTPWN